MFELALLDMRKPRKSRNTRLGEYKRRQSVSVEKSPATKPKRLSVQRDTFPDKPPKKKGRPAIKGVIVEDKSETDLLVSKIAKFRGWRRKYLEVLATTGDRNEAIRKCGNANVNALTIERACDPNNDGYDPVMAEQIEALDKAMLWQIEDNYLAMALKDPNHAKQVLSTRVGHRYAAMSEALRQATGSAGSAIHNHFWFTQDEQGRTVDMLQQLFPARAAIPENANGSEVREGKGKEQAPVIEIAPKDSGGEGEPAADSGGVSEAGDARPEPVESRSGESFSSDGLVRSILSASVHPSDERLEASRKAPSILLGEPVDS